MGNTTNKVLAAKTRKAHKMDALEANRREGLRIGQEYRWGDYVPYAQRQVEPVTRRFTRDQLAHYGIDLPVETGSLGQAQSIMERMRKQRTATTRRLRNVQLVNDGQEMCSIFVDGNQWVFRDNYNQRRFNDRCMAINYANNFGYVKEVTA